MTDVSLDLIFAAAEIGVSVPRKFRVELDRHRNGEASPTLRLLERAADACGLLIGISFVSASGRTYFGAAATSPHVSENVGRALCSHPDLDQLTPQRRRLARRWASGERGATLNAVEDVAAELGVMTFVEFYAAETRGTSVH